MNIIGDVKDRNCFIVDDIVDTAGSLCEGAKALAEYGARGVYAAVCHPVLTDPATERIKNSNIKELIVTNSLPIPKEKSRTSLPSSPSLRSLAKLSSVFSTMLP